MKVLLTRPDRNSADAQLVTQAGATPVIEPLLRTVATDRGFRLLTAFAGAQRGDWLVLTSPRAWSWWTTAAPGVISAVALLRQFDVRLAAIGTATAQSVPFPVDFMPSEATGAALAAELPRTGRAFVPTSANSHAAAVPALRAAGITTISEAVYDTVPREPSPEVAAQIAAGEFAAVILRSPSAVAAWAHLTPPALTTVLTVGPTTTAAAQRAGLVAQPTSDLVAAIEGLR
ncbi:MAG: uroporphyrinogen-III synthase [Propionibacteriaceae bacterium]